MRALIVSCLLLLALPAAAQQQMLPPQLPFLGAEATGEVRVAPDRAVVRFGVQHQDKEARRAQQRVSEAMQRVTKALRDRGIPAERISTERLELQPVYDYNERPQGPHEGPRLVGFRASNVVRVELPLQKGKGGERVGDVIDAAIGGGANTVEGIQFELADDQPHYLRALRLASEKAREKSQALAESLGVGMGRLLEARESGLQFEPPQPMMMEARAMKGGDTPVSPGELTVRASVTVRYEIRQK
ncbi:SIMPL domain-containing protein [Vulgatibacter sp.]|uniref:SIMPL domain-containing protein n=1 Tax=Vulgatibacter sp. TaxID=1971226 RepID=UPI003567EC56